MSESGVTEEGSRRVAWRLAILEKHGHHFPEVGVQLVQALALTVRPREAGEITDEDVRIGVAFDDGRVRTHGDRAYGQCRWTTSRVTHERRASDELSNWRCPVDGTLRDTHAVTRTKAR